AYGQRLVVSDRLLNGYVPVIDSGQPQIRIVGIQTGEGRRGDRRWRRGRRGCKWIRRAGGELPDRRCRRPGKAVPHQLQAGVVERPEAPAHNGLPSTFLKELETCSQSRRDVAIPRG